MRSLKPEELFDPQGALLPELKELAPEGARRMSASPHANGGLIKRDLRLPDFRDYAIEVKQPGKSDAENTRPRERRQRIVAREHHLRGERPPFGLLEVETMRRTASPSSHQP